MSRALLAILLAASPAAAAPNVVFVCSDDERADTIAALGNRHIQTPALDRMARDGFALPSTTVLGGRVVLRLCTINPRTTEEDIERTIERMAEVE